MEKIKRFIECLIPVTVCNLKCDYCYVIQREKNSGKMPEYKYPFDVMKKALSTERLGGTCYFSVCGAGETLAPASTVDVVQMLLENGHYVNITTNGTLTNRFEELMKRLSNDSKSRLHFAFSFHYLELERLNMTDRFFNNVKFVASNGCSFVVQINLYDGYLPYLDEIKKLCLENTGAYPQVAATRKENDLHEDVELMTEFGKEKYIENGNSFHSPLFDFTMKNFNIKRSEFCYAGDWTFTLNLATGIMHRCYCTVAGTDIFKNPDKKIKFCPVGKHCSSLFCMNSSHFMSLGCIPEADTPTYASLRNRVAGNGNEWYTPRMKEFLSGKLCDNNNKATKKDIIKSDVRSILDKIHLKLATVKAKILVRR